MVSELQIALIALGAAVVVGIVLYNKWQERKHRKLAERAFRSDHRDVLLEPGKKAQRIEPQSGGAQDENEAVDDVAHVAGEPGAQWQSVVRQSASPGGRSRTPGLPDEVNASIDVAILIESIETLEVSRLWSVQRDQLLSIGRAVRWFAFDDIANIWKPLSSSSTGAYHWFCVSMQLVDRRGAIGEQAYSTFAEGVHRIADQFLAVLSNMPTRVSVLSAAAELDRFCAKIDVQVGISIIRNDELFAGTKIRSLAEAGGMRLDKHGQFVASGDNGECLFTLCNLESVPFTEDEMRHMHTQGVALLIDIPRVVDGVQIFDRVMRQASQMAKVLNGHIVDDNGAPLAPDGVELIRSQIQHFQDIMYQKQIPAGGALASRLFSA